MVGRGSERCTIPYAVKNLSLALLKMGKVCPKHVELILEINKLLLLHPVCFLYYFTYIDYARSNTNQAVHCVPLMDSALTGDSNKNCHVIYKEIW